MQPSFGRRRIFFWRGAYGVSEGDMDVRKRCEVGIGLENKKTPCAEGGCTRGRIADLENQLTIHLTSYNRPGEIARKNALSLSQKMYLTGIDFPWLICAEFWPFRKANGKRFVESG
jgi:hypothetical protein